MLLPKGADHLAEEEIVLEGKGEWGRIEDGGWRIDDDGSRMEQTAETVEAGPAASPTDAPASDDLRILGLPKILIVEDNDDMRAYLREHLASLYRVIEAADGQEGLEPARPNPT